MQSEFNFKDHPASGADALSLWRKQREEQLLTLARTVGLPLGHHVEVWLRGGICLRGCLQLGDPLLIQVLENHDSLFAVGNTPFRLAEMESCTRL